MFYYPFISMANKDNKEMCHMNKILIVEDDSTLSSGLCRAMKNEETDTVAADNIHSAKELLSKAP